MNARCLLGLLLALAACAQPAPVGREQRVVILHTNDLHGRVRPGGGAPGFAALAAHIKKARADAEAAGARVIVVDAGDFFQGTPEGDLTRGRLVVECMNAIGYDALCLGNHDLDFGPKVTEELRTLARFPFLGANVFRKGTRDPPSWITPSIFFEDVGIELVGLTTSQMGVVTTRKAREGLEFELEERVLEDFRWTPRAVRILLTHIGSVRDRELAARVPQLSAILGGHSHQLVAERVGEIPLLQSLCHGLHVGRMELLLRDGRVVASTMTHETVDPDKRDGDVQAIIDRYAPDIDRVMDEIVGELAQPMSAGSRDRVESSILGNHLTDLMRAAADADVALHNRTGIRASLPKGKVRLRDIYQVSPFGNTVVVMILTGADLRELLERSLAEGTRLLLEVSGLELEWNPAAEAGRRVVAVTVAGRPLDPAVRYRVATNSFLAQGGDGYLAFKRGQDVKDTSIGLLELHREALGKELPLRCSFVNRIHAGR